MGTAGGPNMNALASRGKRYSIHSTPAGTSRWVTTVLAEYCGVSNFQVRVSDQALLADGVKPESVSPYLAAWKWAESGKTTTGLSVATIRTYEADACRVYRLLGQIPTR